MQFVALSLPFFFSNEEHWGNVLSHRLLESVILCAPPFHIIKKKLPRNKDMHSFWPDNQNILENMMRNRRKIKNIFKCSNIFLGLSRSAWFYTGYWITFKVLLLRGPNFLFFYFFKWIQYVLFTHTAHNRR